MFGELRFVLGIGNFLLVFDIVWGWFGKLVIIGIGYENDGFGYFVVG